MNPGTVGLSTTRTDISTSPLTFHIVLSLYYCTPAFHLQCGSLGRLAKIYYLQLQSSVCQQTGRIQTLNLTNLRVKKKLSRLSTSCWKRTNVQLKCLVLCPVNFRNLKPRGIVSSQQHCCHQVCEAHHKTRCAICSRGREHTGCWGKSQLGKTVTMNLTCQPAQPSSKQRKNSGVCKVVVSKQTYYGYRKGCWALGFPLWLGVRLCGRVAGVRYCASFQQLGSLGTHQTWQFSCHFFYLLLSKIMQLPERDHWCQKIVITASLGAKRVAI